MKRGRPRTATRVREIMAERGCSRVWAYKLWNRERAARGEKILTEDDRLDLKIKKLTRVPRAKET